MASQSLKKRQRRKKKTICLHCRNEFNPEDNNLFCPYCQEVILGQEDEDWLPEIALTELKKEKK